MNPVLLSLLWPVLEGAVSRHVADKPTAKAVLKAVRDDLDTSLSEQLMSERLSQERQHQLNILALHQRSIYLAGWRPLAGWACALGVAWVFLGAPMLHTVFTLLGIEARVPDIPKDHLFELLLGLLGMAGIRSFDKLKGRQDKR